MKNYQAGQEVWSRVSEGREKEDGPARCGEQAMGDLEAIIAIPAVPLLHGEPLQGFKQRSVYTI